MTTALQYEQQVRRALGLSGTDVTALPQADVREAVNAALQAISGERDWIWLLDSEEGSLTANTQTLALPAGYTRSLSFSVLYDADERTLTPQVNFADLEGDDETPAEPLYFARLGTDLYLWPVPDDAYSYRHFYYLTEPILDADADVPLIPDQFSRWVVCEAAFRLNIRTVSPETYNELRTEAGEWRERAAKWNFRNKLPLPEIVLTRESVWQDV